MRWVVVGVVVVFAAAASLAVGGIRPADQKLSERLTLQRSDFPSGWRTDSPASTRLERTHCPTAPTAERVITGYSDSAGFVPVDAETDKRSAGSSTRVFSSSAAARTWYFWAGAAKSACDLNAPVASWKRDRPDFKVSRPHHQRDLFILRCPSCPSHELSAWRWGFTVAKHGQNDTAYLYDYVVVRIDRVVVSFSFFAVDTPFGPDEARLVSKLVRRAREA